MTTSPTPTGVRTNIRHIQGKYAGATIYVLASGASMDLIPPPFFDDKITIAVNQVHRRYPNCTYVLSHHAEGCQEVLDLGLTLVCSEFDCGHHSLPRNEFNGDYYYYRHAENQQCKGIDLSALDTDDSLAISASTVADATHFAAHLGASAIVLVGADHGRIDGLVNFQGYNGGLDGSTQPHHLPMTEPLLLRLVNELRKRGRLVMSLNPWINFGLEGHKYSRPPAGTVYMALAPDTAGAKVITSKPGVGEWKAADGPVPELVGGGQ